MQKIHILEVEKSTGHVYYIEMMEVKFGDKDPKYKRIDHRFNCEFEAVGMAKCLINAFNKQADDYPDINFIKFRIVCEQTSDCEYIWIDC